MSRRWIAPIAVGIALLGLLAWGVSRGLERLVAPEPVVETAPPPEAATAHITATLFYASEDGQALVPVRREIALAEGVVAQGREVLASLLEPAPAPYLQVMPMGTRLRAFYVTERGDAFVDLSGELSRAHPGGSLAELLTVYAIVNAVTVNLPAIQRVQILVEGNEVDTVAGHVDVRRPLLRDASLVRDPAAEGEAAP
jgi:hypothetical protein